MVGWHHQLNELEFEQALEDGEGQGDLACSSPWGCKELDMSEQLKNNNITKSQKTVRCCQFSSVQSVSHVQLFATPRTAVRQASLCITNSQSLLKLMSIESVMPSNHLILCRPLLLPLFLSIRSFQMSQFFTSGGQSIGVSASASVLAMNIQD